MTEKLKWSKQSNHAESAVVQSKKTCVYCSTVGQRGSGEKSAPVATTPTYRLTFERVYEGRAEYFNTHTRENKDDLHSIYLFFVRFCFSIKKYARFRPHFYTSISALARLLLH